MWNYNLFGDLAIRFTQLLLIFKLDRRKELEMKSANTAWSNDTTLLVIVYILIVLFPKEIALHLPHLHQRLLFLVLEVVEALVGPE